MRRRQSPRIEADVWLDYAGSEVLLYHRVRNISLGGVCIETPTVEPVGTRVALSLTFPELDASMDVEGEVVWANEHPPRDMGIRFVGLDASQRELLRTFLRRRQHGG